MRVYFQPAREFSGATGAVINVAPDDVTIRTVAGVIVQAALAHAVDGAGHYYVSTADALYTSGTKYVLWTTTTTSLGVVTEDHPFTHGTTTTADTTPPAAPGIAIQSWTDTSVTVAHVPPSDSDYDHTVVYAVLVPGDGSTAPATASGSGASITVAGLQSGRSYILVAIAYDTSGNPSVVGRGAVGGGQTWPTDSPELPLLVKCFVNQEAAPRKVYALDPTLVDASGAPMLNFELRPNTRGRTHRVRLECHAPVKIRLRSLGGTFHVRDGEVGGLKGSRGN